MTTPKGQGRIPRTPTPRFSERKKQLFSVSHKSKTIRESVEDEEGDGDEMHGISPLPPTVKITGCDSSPENNKENKSSARAEEQLPLLFTTTMRLNSNSSGEATPPKSSQNYLSSKRGYSSSGNGDLSDSSTESPQCKQRKTLKQCIPTLSFYSHSKNGATLSPESPRNSSTNTGSPVGSRSRSGAQRNSKAKATSPTTRRQVGINKGVRHKIRKPQRSSGNSSGDVDGILNSLRNEKLRQLITTKREERAKVEQVHHILRTAQDPIQMAKPLSVIAADDANNNNSSDCHKEINKNVTADFSDLSDEEDNEEATMTTSAMEIEPVIALIRHDGAATPAPGKRKFFKSGQRRTTNMEVRITDNIRASVSQGKIALVEASAKNMRRIRIKSTTKFSAEQATVDAILRDLDTSTMDDMVKPEGANQCNLPSEISEDQYASFRHRLPYKTNDPAVFEQQELLLEFLISNNICTEENFEIFIADPDNHKEQATRIVDELYMVVTAEKVELQPEAVSNEGAVQEEAPIEQQPKLFPIFTERLQPLPVIPSSRRMGLGNQRLHAAAVGSNQYQIDAGQKAYGARQCPQCGLVYVQHEPEEEKLHQEYHNASHILRFKGWIDEDVVGVFPEWANDARIIRMSERSPTVRLQRLHELIKVVDKELGHSFYKMPECFVAYLAISKKHFVGFCLVQPLTQAHRFIHFEGNDYISEEPCEASCGVSRIWVSPLHRRQGIASKLIRAVQCHTILGQELDLKSIAFSSPTDEGRELARYITKTDNFLIYQYT